VVVVVRQHLSRDDRVKTKAKNMNVNLQAPAIGIMSALPQENEAILRTLENPKSIRIGNQEFVTGKIASHNVVLVVSGMGKVNAAMSAQKLISEFKVKMIVFSGVAGAVNPALSVGDVVLANAAFQSDFGFLGSVWSVHRPGHLPEIGLGDADASLLYLLEHAALDFKKIQNELSAVQLAKVPVNESWHQPALRIGVVATGDQFIANSSKKLELRKLGADAVEMEGASVAQVCESSNVPLVLLRFISDHAEDESHIDFQKFFPVVAENGSLLVQCLVKSIG